MPFLKDKLTSFVNEGRRISIHFLTICVGHGSREQVLESFLDELEEFPLSDTLKGTENWTLVRMKRLRSGVFEKQTRSICL